MFDSQNGSTVTEIVDGAGSTWTKEVQNILLKRGNEWHGPEFMYLTSSHIVMIEPVSSTSGVAELIKELKAKQPEKPAEVGK